MLRLSSLFHLPRWMYIIAAILWAVAIMLLLTMPRTSIPDVKILHADKVAHASLFAVQVLLLWLSMRPRHHRRGMPNISLILSFIIASLYGISTELIQKAAATRTADPFDALADITGAAIASYLIFRQEATLIPEKSSRSES